MHLGNISLAIFTVILSCTFGSLQATAAAIPSSSTNMVRGVNTGVEPRLALSTSPEKGCGEGEQTINPNKIKGRQSCNFW
ncbi:hypothetical protein V8F33_002295 [Rhypophila sp. PSN 637]